MVWYKPWNRHPESPGADSAAQTPEARLAALLSYSGALQEQLKSSFHETPLGVLELLAIMDEQAEIMGASDERPQN